MSLLRAPIWSGVIEGRESEEPRVRPDSLQEGHGTAPANVRPLAFTTIGPISGLRCSSRPGLRTSCAVPDVGSKACALQRGGLFDTEAIIALLPRATAGRQGDSPAHGYPSARPATAGPPARVVGRWLLESTTDDVDLHASTGGAVVAVVRVRRGQAAGTDIGRQVVDRPTVMRRARCRTTRAPGPPRTRRSAPGGCGS